MDNLEKIEEIIKNAVLMKNHVHWEDGFLNEIEYSVKSFKDELNEDYELFIHYIVKEQNLPVLVKTKMIMQLFD